MVAVSTIWHVVSACLVAISTYRPMHVPPRLLQQPIPELLQLLSLRRALPRSGAQTDTQAANANCCLPSFCFSFSFSFLT